MSVRADHCPIGGEPCQSMCATPCSSTGKQAMSEHRRFTQIAAKPHTAIAGELAARIKELIYEHADVVPLALVIGVLRIVEKDVLDEQRRSKR